MLVGMLGILKAGCAYVPLDPTYPASRRDYMMADTGMSQVITQSGLAGLFADLDVTRIVLDDETTSRRIASLDMTRLDDKPPSDALAYIIYTSGSTGQPKGVMIEHKGVVRLVKQPGELQMSSATRFLHCASIAFDAAVFELWSPLINGGVSILYPSTDLTLETLNEVIQRYEVNTALIVSGLFDIWSETCSGLAGLRRVFVGGDKLNPAAVIRCQKNLPHVQLYNAYGPTENTVITTLYKLPEQINADQSLAIGRGLKGDFSLVLSQTGSLLPVGVVGELLVGGDGLARGYFNRPQLTASCFVPNPYYDINQSHGPAYLYRTGDLVSYQDDGNLQFHGRVDQQLKVRGYRVEPTEIQFHLEQHPDVRRALVIPAEEANNRNYLVGYVELENDAEKTDTLVSVKYELSQQLPKHLIPSTLILVSSWPLTANGKIDLKKLPKAEVTKDKKSVAPVTQLECQLAELWSKTLDIQKENLCVYDNFFELGGHSLSVMKMVSLASEYSLCISAKEVFAFPVLKELAEQLAERDTQDAEFVVPENR
ncbi:non-ribosomal peptide synthetase, partial [Pseudoalteromonas rubra]